MEKEEQHNSQQPADHVSGLANTDQVSCEQIQRALDRLAKGLGIADRWAKVKSKDDHQ
jgi:hypothetical protein